VADTLTRNEHLVDHSQQASVTMTISSFRLGILKVWRQPLNDGRRSAS
jgi:hypothetical protein